MGVCVFVVFHGGLILSIFFGGARFFVANVRCGWVWSHIIMDKVEKNKSKVGRPRKDSVRYCISMNRVLGSMVTRAAFANSLGRSSFVAKACELYLSKISKEKVGVNISEVGYACCIQSVANSSVLSKNCK